MAEFAVDVVTVRSIEPIPGADAIELAVIGDFRSVVRKGSVKPGEPVLYYPEGALMPEALLKRMGLYDYDKQKGRLAGTAGTRIKAARFRGCLSQGIVEPLSIASSNTSGIILDLEGNTHVVDVGDTNVAEIMGVTKWMPTIPSQLAGLVFYHPTVASLKYDLENYKRFPDVLKAGEEVVFTEKIHGTQCSVLVMPTNVFVDEVNGHIIVSSKGSGSEGLGFQDAPGVNENNTYLKALKTSGVFDILKAQEFTQPTRFYGEVFGTNVQDLGYSTKNAEFRLFDVAKQAENGRWSYLNYTEKVAMAEQLSLKMVPIVYKGPFSREVMLEHTSGPETLSGQKAHIREGIVVTPVEERYSPDLGRVILKSVSEAYLDRKGNTTEYQ